MEAWTRELKKSKTERRREIFLFLDRNVDEKAQEDEDMERQRRIFFFFLRKRERKSSRNRRRNDGMFLGGNMDDKAQENEDETIKSKKERLEGVCERSSACSVFFFLVSIKLL